MFIVQILQKFEFEGMNFPYPIKIDVGKMIGFLPVYEKCEDAQKDYPDRIITEIKFVES